MILSLFSLVFGFSTAFCQISTEYRFVRQEVLDSYSADTITKVNVAGVHSSSSNNYEAVNTFKQNNLSNASSSTGGQIQFADNAALAQLFFTSSQARNSKNNFIRNSTSDNYFYFENSSGTVDLSNVNNNNYWENGNGASDPPPVNATGAMPMLRVQYDPLAGNATSLNTLTGIGCSGGGGGGAGNKSSEYPQAIAEVSEDCENLYLRSLDYFQGKEWQKTYDSLKHYIETCFAEKKSYRAFGLMTAPNQNRDSNLNRYPEHREWLKKVLYYNADTLYYCADVQGIISTFTYFDSVRGKSDALGQMAVIRYLLETNKCWYLNDFLIQSLKEDSEYVRNTWADTVTDPTATPIDTTVPTLEELDLGVLRGPLEVTAQGQVPRIGGVIAVRNPFTDVLALIYRLDQNAMTRIDIYDLLGKAMYAEAQGYKHEGEYRVSLSTTNWPSGSYYVRLSTPSGEVKTVKVIKE